MTRSRVIKFLDVAAGFLELEDEINCAIQKVVSSGQYILGTEVEEFEKEYALYCGAAHCVGLGNGLDALTLALRSVGVGPGDEVIVPASTFIATWLSVSNCGATPIPVEIDTGTCNLDPDGLSEAISERTRAIVPVHLYGQPADIQRIQDVAQMHGLAVVEDAAQAHGAKYKGETIGKHADITAWSFYPSKNLGAMGDGGAITTNNKKFASKVRLLSNYGATKKYVYRCKGVNSRLDPIQAAILRVKLKHLDKWNFRRQEIAKEYLARLGVESLNLPTVPDWAEPSWHLFVIRVTCRDELQKGLAAEGVETGIHYPIPPHLQRAYQQDGARCGHFPITERLAKEALSLPIGPHCSEEDVDVVVRAIKKILPRRKPLVRNRKML